MPIPDFSLLHEISTARLELRPLRESDVNAIFFLRSDAVVNRHIKRPRLTTTNEALAFITRIRHGASENKILYWAITLKGNPALIGTVCLWNFPEDYTSGELGYELHPDFHGQGIMSEAVQAVLKLAFENLNLKTIEAFTNRNNSASKILLERHGFFWDASRTDAGYPENVIYVLAAET